MSIKLFNNAAAVKNIKERNRLYGILSIIKESTLISTKDTFQFVRVDDITYRQLEELGYEVYNYEERRNKWTQVKIVMT